MTESPDQWRRQYDTLYVMRKQRDAAYALASALSDTVETMTCPALHPDIGVRCLKAVGHPDTHYAVNDCTGLIWGPITIYPVYQTPQDETMAD